MSAITTKDGRDIFYKDFRAGQPLLPSASRAPAADARAASRAPATRAAREVLQ
ncbi:hypothetical protein [Roseixanthobacter pseudopolyaromaticivorans]|uniref:hypothetical protein n=1 Tax=Xanthobacteraceae TaxID=335928 RepID=UPI00372AFAED